MLDVVIALSVTISPDWIVQKVDDGGASRIVDVIIGSRGRFRGSYTCISWSLSLTHRTGFFAALYHRLDKFKIQNVRL